MLLFNNSTRSMNEKIKLISSFGLLLLFVTTLTFLGHLAVLYVKELPLFNNLIVNAYLLNIIFAFAVFILMIFLSDKHQNILGFVFMSSSLVKFGLFFLLFYPVYHFDGKMSRVEFLTFFIPYAVCLVVETRSLIIQLNKTT